MLGFYDYTVLLTYMSLISAGLGIVISLQGEGHPYIGTFFLLFCGLCDAFDGKVARLKQNRTEDECKFGIQIDSLSDLVAFGVLPACIGEALMWKTSISNVPTLHEGHVKSNFIIPLICFALLLAYILAAMIRLAYFNVMEEKRQKEEEGPRKFYTGLPVTSAALIFPTVMLWQFLTPQDLTALYFAGLAVTAFLFVSKIKVRKPGLKGICGLIAIGAGEFIILIWYMIINHLIH